MSPPRPLRSQTLTATVLVLAIGCAPADVPVASTNYDDLVELFGEWREFERPTFVDGVPDYSPAAMVSQHADLASYQDRLEAIDPSAWSVIQQIDRLLVGAEMRGLDFDHRVRRPWARNPAFYTMIFAAQSAGRALRDRVGV